MRPYGRMAKLRGRLHGAWCLVCHPPTRQKPWHHEPYLEDPIKARERQRAKREIRRELDELYGSTGGGDARLRASVRRPAGS